ncbi:MAG: hypothetical protein ACERKJ_07870 [Candidatus Dadabacteria bacterium]
MAEHLLYKTNQYMIPSIKPGSNWFFFRINWTETPFLQNDTAKICEVKDHWILKSGFTRATVATSGAASMDIGTATTGQEIDTAIAIDSGTDTWLKMDGATDNTPIAITADGHIFIEVLDAAVDDGITDIMLEIIVPAWDTETDSLAE